MVALICIIHVKSILEAYCETILKGLLLKDVTDDAHVRGNSVIISITE